MRRTKIVCTIGPASEKLDVLKALIKSGMDVARLNFSHGSHGGHKQRIRLIRQAASETGVPVPLMLDTRGPEIRIGKFSSGKVVLDRGASFFLTAEKIIGDDTGVHINYEGIAEAIKPGDIILLADGLVELQAEQIISPKVICRVINGGEISDYKGVNLPGIKLNFPFLSKQDIEDISFGVEHEVDFIAASFVRSPDDVLSVRRLLEQKGSDAAIIAKIENQEGIDNFDHILEVSDGIMVARGDLGVEIPPENVPLVQKEMIDRCNRTGKPVITATQMLDSMIQNPRPTRAEASDVANAIFDGTDAVMLSGETAAGLFPVESTATMARIAERIEQGLQYEAMLEYFEPAMERTVTDAISYATCHTAQELGAAAIITPTHSGHTARMVSKYRPKSQIAAVTPNPRVAAKLKLTWGVFPIQTKTSSNTDGMFSGAVEAALKAGVIAEGDLVVITAGVPVGASGTTNLLRVYTVAEVLFYGSGVGRRTAAGTVRVACSGEEAQNLQDGEVLVTVGTDSSYFPALERAAAIIAEEGGLTSSAAIVGLQLGIPVVVGAKNAVSALKTGDVVTVDGRRGQVLRGRANIL